LSAVKKGITAKQSRAAVETAHRAGIKTAGHFIFGLPGETRETMADTLAFALSLPLDIAQFYAAAPFPGTSLYDEAIEKGWLKRAGGSETSDVSQSKATMELPGLSSKEVDAFRRYAFRRFYMRPSAAARVLAMAEPGAVVNLLPVVRRYRQWLPK
jgi:anaerobic magnesium-protoporphyrin IX monomethyl ester cyclase